MLQVLTAQQVGVCLFTCMGSSQQHRVHQRVHLTHAVWTGKEVQWYICDSPASTELLRARPSPTGHGTEGEPPRAGTALTAVGPWGGGLAVRALSKRRLHEPQGTRCSGRLGVPSLVPHPCTNLPGTLHDPTALGLRVPTAPRGDTVVSQVVPRCDTDRHLGHHGHVLGGRGAYCWSGSRGSPPRIERTASSMGACPAYLHPELGWSLVGQQAALHPQLPFCPLGTAPACP